MSSRTHNWPRNDAYFWQEAPMLRLLLPLALGIFYYDRWPDAASTFDAFAALFLAFISFGVLSTLRSRSLGIAVGRTLFLHLTLFVLGYAFSGMDDVRTNGQWAGKDVFFAQGHIVRLEEPQEKARIWRVPVSFVAARDSLGLVGKAIDKFKPAVGKGFLNFYKSDEPFPFREGDTLIVPAKWTVIQNSGNPFAFDYARFLQRKGTHFQQFLSAEEAILAGKASPQQKG